MKCPNKNCIDYHKLAIGDCSYYRGIGCLHEDMIALNTKYRKWGLSPEQLRQLYEQQNYRCGICNRIMIPPQLDHDHKTHKARGYLCRSCNKKLAGIDDDDFRSKALKYIKNPPAERFYTCT